MTTPSDGPVPEDHETQSSGDPQPDGAAGVELGLSEGPGGTFEPEEDVSPES
jgi:hypothetical protein